MRLPPPHQSRQCQEPAASRSIGRFGRGQRYLACQSDVPTSYPYFFYYFPQKFLFLTDLVGPRLCLHFSDKCTHQLARNWQSMVWISRCSRMRPSHKFFHRVSLCAAIPPKLSDNLTRSLVQR